MGDLANFSSTFPDIPPQQNEFKIYSDAYISGNGDISQVQGSINSLSNLIVSLKSYQSNLIAKTPEYTDQSAAPMFLSNISTVSVQASTLQNTFNIAQENIANSQNRYSGNISAIIFYTYSSATILLGILSIFLTTHLVFTYMGSSVSVGISSTNNARPFQGGRRKA